MESCSQCMDAQSQASLAAVVLHLGGRAAGGLQISPQCASKVATLPCVRAFDHANRCERVANFASVRAFNHAKSL